MAISDIASALTDYPWSDIKKAAKHAMVTAALGGSTLTINGRQIGRITISDAQKLYELASTNEADESSTTSDGIALVNYSRRV